MNTSTASPSTPSQETSPSFCGRLDWVALGLLLIGACLAAMEPNASFKAEAPKPALGNGAMQHPMETRSFPHRESEDGNPSATPIRRLPTTIITADAIAAERGFAPRVLAVETFPAVEIVPLADLQSNPSTRP